MTSSSASRVYPAAASAPRSATRRSATACRASSVGDDVSVDDDNVVAAGICDVDGELVLELAVRPRPAITSTHAVRRCLDSDRDAGAGATVVSWLSPRHANG